MLKVHSGLRTPTIEFFTVFGILFLKLCRHSVRGKYFSDFFFEFEVYLRLLEQLIYSKSERPEQFAVGILVLV